MGCRGQVFKSVTLRQANGHDHKRAARIKIAEQHQRYANTKRCDCENQSDQLCKHASSPKLTTLLGAGVKLIIGQVVR